MRMGLPPQSPISAPENKSDCMDYRNLSVIIPTLNEDASIASLIRMLLDNYPCINVIIADDGSTDSTRRIAESMNGKKVVFIDRSSSPVHGLTASVLDGIAACQTKYFIVMDGDLQHPPEKVGEIFERLAQGKKIVIASREKVDSEWGVKRMAVSYGATFLGWLRLLPRNYFSCDIMSGFFGMEASMCRQVIAHNPAAFVPEGYKVLFDLLKCMPREDICQVKYVFGSRQFGRSKLGARHVISFVKSLLK